MKKLVLLVLGFVVFMVACGDSKQEATDAVDKVEKQMQEKAMMGIDSALANAAISAYQNYYTQYPDDSISVEYKLRAADVMMNVQRYQESIALLDEIIALEDQEITPKVMLLKAYIFETGVQNFSEAEKAYNALINRFPKHPLAEEARGSIKLLGMSEEQLLKFLNKQNPTDSVAAE